jgi:hypothetical protein
MTLRILAILVLGTGIVVGQQGTAPSGYYPSYYHGSTFTGDVVDAGDALTLKYTKGKKTQTFVGRFEKPCDVPTKDGKIVTISPADIPLGSNLTAYYYVRSNKVDGKKIDENVIIQIDFNLVNGKPFAANKQNMYNCSTAWERPFKAF